MIQLPRPITDKQFRSSVKKGTVLKTTLTFFDRSSKTKRIVCLNHALEDKIIFAVATSQVNQRNKVPLLRKNSILIVAGAAAAFEKDTLINLKELRVMKLDELMRRFNEAELEILDDLPEVITQDIETIVRDSLLIERWKKKLVIDDTQ